MEEGERSLTIVRLVHLERPKGQPDLSRRQVFLQPAASSYIRAPCVGLVAGSEGAFTKCPSLLGISTSRV